MTNPRIATVSGIAIRRTTVTDSSGFSASVAAAAGPMRSSSPPVLTPVTRASTSAPTVISSGPPAKREARAAARLHHTNIVPVFGVGEHEGLHYYVMQFIKGLGLNEVIKEVQQNNSKDSKERTMVNFNLSKMGSAQRQSLLIFMK